MSNDKNFKALDQMLEDMAGDEFDDFDSNSNGLSNYGTKKRTNFEELDIEIHDL